MSAPGTFIKLKRENEGWICMTHIERISRYANVGAFIYLASGAEHFVDKGEILSQILVELDIDEAGFFGED